MAARSLENAFCAGKSRLNASSRRSLRQYQSQNSMSSVAVESGIFAASGLIFMMRPCGVMYGYIQGITYDSST